MCEVMNYREHGKANRRPEGDQIVILEDTNGDGVADSRKTYYQGHDVDAALGICILGNKVIVTCAPNVIIFTDENGDDHPDRKEYLFRRAGSPQDDHSTHSFVFGPDGKLYWNMGNNGAYVHDQNEALIVDKAGHYVVDRRTGRRSEEFKDKTGPYWGGMVFRCNVDGSEFEVLGHNFRNNYEVTIDSFGNLWQSDNDDDGNYGVRINYVMEYGNFGYLNTIDGAGWRTYRVGQNEDVRQRHWHQNDPGVVPNFAQTGAGSPTGITVYEGELLPETFQNEVIHCDAGPGVVWAVKADKKGAGYEGRTVNLINGKNDKWFRPVDVAVAPDGSLFVSDWYDPVVGWNRQSDLVRGRVYRIAPKGVPYRVPRFEFKSANGAAAAMKNPNYAVRYRAWQSLNKMQVGAEDALMNLYRSDQSRLRARALWLLANIKGRGPSHILESMKDADEDIRIVALKAAQRLSMDMIPLLRQMAHDPSVQVRRECALALRFIHSSEAARIWAELAMQHKADDRWSLEALGIGADLHWDTFLKSWFENVGEQWNTEAGRDLIWRSRSSETPGYLAKIILDPLTNAADCKRYLRAFDFQTTSPEKDSALATIAITLSKENGEKNLLASTEALLRLKDSNWKDRSEYREALGQLLEFSEGTPEFIRLIRDFDIQDRQSDLIAIVTGTEDSPEAVDAVRTLLDSEDEKSIDSHLENADQRKALIRALAKSHDARGIPFLGRVILQRDTDFQTKLLAVRGLARTSQGIQFMIRLAEENKFPTELEEVAGAAITGTMHVVLRSQAAEHFPIPPLKNDETLPQMTELLVYSGDVPNGRETFWNATCVQCHTIHGEGVNFGPDLSEIGNKLSKQGLYESILDPNASVSPAYQGYAFQLKDRTQVDGYIVSETDESISVRQSGGITVDLIHNEIESRRKLSLSLMPAGLQQMMSVTELVDLVEYLSSQK